MKEALFLNGVYESVLEEIAKDCMKCSPKQTNGYKKCLFISLTITTTGEPTSTNAKRVSGVAQGRHYPKANFHPPTSSFFVRSVKSVSRS